MDMKEVVSGNIAAVGYEVTEEQKEPEGTFEAGNLDIKFKSGTTYRYKKVPRDTEQEFMEAESKGKYFASEIKPHFECFKLVKVVDPETKVETITEVRV